MSGVCPDGFGAIKVEVRSLADICDQYVVEDNEILFLKMDTLGAEEKVLLGADFEKYRPIWAVVEQNPDCNLEHVMTQNRYVFAKQVGINKYYIRNESIEYSARNLVNVLRRKIRKQTYRK